MDAVRQPVLIFQFPGDGLTQPGITGHGRISGIVVVDGFLGSLLNRLGRVEIGLAHTQVNDIHALRFHLAALLRHRQRGRWCQTIDSI